MKFSKKKRNQMKFDEILPYLRNGFIISRVSWPEGKSIYLVEENEYTVNTKAAKKIFGEDSKVQYETYIAEITEHDTVTMWFPTYLDLLSDDWCVIEIN